MLCDRGRVARVMKAWRDLGFKRTSESQPMKWLQRVMETARPRVESLGGILVHWRTLEV